jgi:hypothetical protein
MYSRTGSRGKLWLRLKYKSNTALRMAKHGAEGDMHRCGFGHWSYKGITERSIRYQKVEICCLG